MKKRFLNIMFLLSVLAVVAQTPGALITTHIPSGTLSLLNPDDNNWVTSSGSAFSSDDQTESEISWVSIPQYESEISGDLNVGGSCGTTDIMDDPSTGSDASYVYFQDTDGIPGNGDEYMFYRLRIAKDPGNGNFGFSVLVDIDEAFGYNDVDSVEGNPGFEMEIRVVNGGGSKGVYLDDVSGTTSGTNVAFYNINFYTQRSYALSQNSACSSKPAVFYDFIVPFADIQNHFGITVDDPMRLVGATSINGATVLGNTASDIAGINDDNYANTIAGQDKAFSDFLKYQKGSSSSSATGFGVLPVELVKFEVLPTNGTNLITWTTGMELNNDYFVVEKSLNGKDFHSIGEVNGNGKSSHEIDYNFIDEAPYENTYYRLKQVDLDGSVEYSKVILAKQDRKSRVSYSIKDAGKFIKVNPANNKTSVSIFNIQGALVRTMMISDVTIIDYNNLSAGIYSMIIENINERISQSFIVK